MLRDWVRKAERSGRPIAIRSTEPGAAMSVTDEFMPVSLPENPTQSPIRIEVRRKGRTVSIEWPASAASECARLLRELMR
jgi:leucyl-tRNA synthetase